MKNFGKKFLTLKDKPLYKKFVNAVILLFLLVSVYFFSGDIFHYSDVPLFSGAISLLSALVLLIPYYVYHNTFFQKKFNLKFLYFMEFLLALVLFFNGLGANNLYKAGFEYDSFMHFFGSGLIVMLLLCLILATWKKLIKNKNQILYLSIGIILALGLFFEAYEFYGDVFFGTKMSGQVGQPYDTYLDLVLNTLGGIAASFIIIIKYKEIFKSWEKK